MRNLFLLCVLIFLNIANSTLWNDMSVVFKMKYYTFGEDTNRCLMGKIEYYLKQVLIVFA